VANEQLQQVNGRCEPMVIRRALAVVLVRIQVLGAIAMPKGCIVSEVCNGSLTRHAVCSKTASTKPLV